MEERGQAGILKMERALLLTISKLDLTTICIIIFSNFFKEIIQSENIE